MQLWCTILQCLYLEVSCSNLLFNEGINNIGYDGAYRNDFHEFNFVTRTWGLVHSSGEIPRARYRGTCVVSDDNMILHGGHDGGQHLQDTHIFDFNTSTWSILLCDGPVPAPRDSHIAVMHKKSMYIYGGSTGL